MVLAALWKDGGSTGARGGRLPVWGGLVWTEVMAEEKLATVGCAMVWVMLG